MKIVRIVVFVLALSLIVPLGAMAQEPGEGGLIVEGSTRSSANLGPLVPIRCSGVDCSNPNALLYPGLIGINPDTQGFAANEPGNLATGWEVSEDGFTYTVSLRDDFTWSDGEPITAEDVLFSWQAIQQGETVGLSSSYAQARRDVVGAEIIDDFTIEFTLATASCEGIRAVSLVPPLPGHAYGWTVDAADSFEWESLIDHPFDDAPTVTSGPFSFNRLEPGTAIYLQADQSYADPINGTGVMPEGYIFLDTPDEVVMIERFLSFRDGEPNYLREPNQYDSILESDAQYLNAPGRVWHYLALNLADPQNPQNGLDADGNPVDQGQHPLFGDVRVRQAMQHAVNIDEIIDGPHSGNATPMVSSTISTAFTIDPDLERRAFDLDAARALLDEAGWVSEEDALVDGGDGLRVCRGCETAEDGTPFFFQIMNPGDVRNDVSVILQNQFAQVGLEVEVTPLDFNTMYDTNMGTQTFDAAVAGWRGGLPFNPDQRSFFGAENDIFGEGYGFNFGSYYNAEFEALSDQVANLPGCDEATRIDLAQQATEILYQEQPYVWLYELNSVYAATPSIEGFDPRPNFGTWNVDSWVVRQ